MQLTGSKIHCWLVIGEAAIHEDTGGTAELMGANVFHTLVDQCNTPTHTKSLTHTKEEAATHLV